jgi:hypothetical protein
MKDQGQFGDMTGTLGKEEMEKILERNSLSHKD